MLLEMVQSATEQITQCDLEWKANEMQFACWSSALDETDLELTTIDVNPQDTESAGKCW